MSEPASPNVPAHPVSAICGKLFDSYKNGQWIEALQAFDELQAHDLESLPELRGEIVRAWGRGVIAASQINPDDREHLQEIIEDFETRFGQQSHFLRALSLPAETAVEALQQYIAGNGNVLPNEAIDGITEKFRNCTCDDVRAILKFLHSHQIDFSAEISDKLQRPFLRRMKTEDCEQVLQEMVSAGLRPVNSYPYNFIFLKTNLVKPLVEHYFDMLCYGIKPPSTMYRLILRNQHLPRDDFMFFRRRAAMKTDMEPFYEKKLRQASLDHEANEALQILKCMDLDGVVPDRVAFNLGIAACKAKPEVAEEIYRRMVQANVQPNGTTFTYLIQIWRDSKEKSDAVDRWISEMQARGVDLDLHNYTSLLDSYVRANARGKAQSCLKHLIARREGCIAVYNTAMKLGPFDWALGCLGCLLSEGLQPSHHTRSTMQSLVRDDISEEIVAALLECDWDRQRILSCEKIVSPQKGTTPSIVDCMRFMLREIKADDELIKLRSEMLQAEIEAAKSNAMDKPSA
jgi:hypothetical protein